jgi:hypothetical protein
LITLVCLSDKSINSIPFGHNINHKNHQHSTFTQPNVEC